METPKVSVIIPTLNAGKTLRACLLSLQTQTIQLQILICDGGSNDDTLQIAREFSTVEVLTSTDDKGIYDAMNTGIDHAKGEWLLFLGADDQLAETSALAQMINAANNECDLIIAKVRNLPPRHRLVNEWYEARWDEELYRRNIVHHQGVIYRRELFKDYRYPSDLKIFGDYHLNLKLFMAGKKACLTEVHLSDCAADGRSKRFRSALYREEWRMKRSILPFSKRWYQPFLIFLKYLRKRFS